MPEQGMVAAGHTATAEAGAAILRAGGNAVDAAIAAVCTSFCAEPVLTAAGGGGFMLVAAPHQRPVLYDGFARMPRSIIHHGSTTANFSADTSTELKAIPIDFGDTVQTFHIGQASVGTPSLPAMLFEAHLQHGKLPLREALMPGIEAAKNGIRLNHLQASFIKLLQPILSSSEPCKSLHAPAGKLLVEGDCFRNPDLGNILEMLAIEGIDEMYHGDLARTIVSACTPHGLLGMEDMCSQQVNTRTPLSTPMFGGTLLTNPPPSSGGLLITFAACLLDRLPAHDVTAKTPWPVLITEALHAASSIRHQGLDARIHKSDIESEILNRHLLQTQMDNILQRLRGIAQDRHDEPVNRNGSTTHISIVDKDGMAVSLTTSNGEGSGIVVPGTGIHLNNMLGEEDINPLGFHALPGGTMLSSMMAPSIFMKDGRPAIVLGSGGSNRLRGAILQVLTRHLLLNQSIEEAVHAPRLHNEGDRLDIEPDFLSDHEKDQLIQMGWKLNPWQQQSVYFGGVNAISCDIKGQLCASGDPRRGGAVCCA
ncbi:MAG: gamma-glutamyltransferase [Mariprofundus sp.]|nr:gamma-glutamyltransferase [Mariprofundus sp.]